MMIRPLAFVVLSVVAATASAAPKVALTSIDGDTSGDVRDAVADALDGKDLMVIGEKETNRAFDKLGVSELSEKDARKLAKALEADAVIHPMLEKKEGNKVLKFKLFVNGKKAKGFSVQFKNPKSPKFKTALRNKMVERISNGGETEAAAEEERPAKKKKQELDDEDPVKSKKMAKEDEEPAPKKKKNGDKADKAEREDKEDKAEKEAAKEDKAEEDKTDEAKAERAAQEDAEGPDEEAKPKKKKKTASLDSEDPDEEPAIVKRMESKHSANRVAVRLDIGGGAAARSLVFNSRNDFPERPNAFRTAPIGSARVEGEIYPLAFLNPRSLIAGIGLAGEYDKSPSVNVKSVMMAKQFPADQQHWSVGARIRIPFGRSAIAPTTTLGFDYGRRKFKVDRSGLGEGDKIDLPDTHYQFFAPGLSFRVPLGTQFVALIAGGEAMLIRDAGPIQKANSYGKAKIFGFSAAGGFDIVLANRFALRLTAEFTQIGFTFLGAGGAEANARDGDPQTKDVGGAADRSIGGAATLGVLY